MRALILDVCCPIDYPTQDDGWWASETRDIAC